MFRLGFSVAGFLVFAMAGCGDTGEPPTPPVEEWCDLDRPRENCEIQGAQVSSLEDMKELCQSPCTAIGSFSANSVGTEVLKGLGGFTKFDRIAIGSLPEDVKDFRFLSGPIQVQNLEVYSSPGIQNLRGLENVDFGDGCAECERKVTIQNNPGLRSLDGLQNVTQLESLSIESNANLEVIDGFDALTSTGIYIFGNERLRRISGFQSLETSSGIGITINQNLERIDGFPNLTQLDSLNLDRNRKLNLCDVDRVLGQLDQDPEIVSITESGSPCPE